MEYDIVCCSIWVGQHCGIKFWKLSESVWKHLKHPKVQQVVVCLNNKASVLQIRLENVFKQDKKHKATERDI